MENYPFSPEDCLILRAFKDAKSLREAAKTLACDPSGLMHKAQRISRDYGYLRKVDGRWCLSGSGRDLVAWTEESILSQKRLLQSKRTLRISSTSWFAERAIIPHLKLLHNRLKGEFSISVTTPVKDFEQELNEGGTDFVIVCHPPEDPGIAHRQVADEKWTIIAPASWGEVKGGLKREDLPNRPFIRHSQINPFAVLTDLLPKAIPQVVSEIDSFIGVRAAVVHGLGWSYVPRILVSDLIERNDIVEVNYGSKMDRKVCVWWLRNRKEIFKHTPSLCAWIAEVCAGL